MPKPWRYVQLVAGTRPDTWTIATAFLGEPVGDLVLRGMVLPDTAPATTYDLAEPEAARLAELVERYIERMEK